MATARNITETIFMVKCISKRWNSFISDPFFASFYVSRRINIFSSSYLMPWTILTGYGQSSFYRNYSDQTKLVRLCYDDYKSPTMSVLDFPLSEQKQKHKYFVEICRILASGGLILCYADNTSIYYVCNPLTRQWVVLPAPVCACRSNYEAFVTQVEGAVVASYKAIRLLPLLRNYPTNCLTMEIFHSETGVWKPQKVNCPRNVLVCWYKIPTTFKGIVHWFLECSTSNHILAYDPDNNIDQCRLIELPILLSYNETDLCRVSQGYLHYVRTVLDGLQVWVLEDYDSGKWEFKYNITWDGIRTKVLGFHPFDSGIVYVHRKKQILSYNTRIKSWELIYDLDFGDIACYSSVVLPFVLPLWPPSVPHTSLGVRLLCSG